jgi:hypothetical protein
LDDLDSEEDLLAEPDLDDIKPDDADLDDDHEASVAAKAQTAVAATAAMGMSRPRAKGGNIRSRSLTGFEPVAPLRKSNTSAELGSVASARPEREMPSPDFDRKPDTSRRPKTDRKALLPDVEELDASLRDEAGTSRRRDRDLMQSQDEDNVTKSGKFRRAFVWTVFIVALFLALYVLRPLLISAVPALATVLNPYAAIIDSIRLLIEGLLGR